MNSCKNCGAPMVQMILTSVCKAECDLTRDTPAANSEHEFGTYPWALQLLLAGKEVHYITGASIYKYEAGKLYYRYKHRLAPTHKWNEVTMEPGWKEQWSTLKDVVWDLEGCEP